MTQEEFTGVVTFDELDPSAAPILRSSKFFVVNTIDITLNIPGDYRLDFMLETRKIVLDRPQ